MPVSDIDWPVVGAGAAVEHDERVWLRLGGGGVWGEGGGEPPAFVLQVVALVLKVGDFMSDDSWRKKNFATELWVKPMQG